MAILKKETRWAVSKFSFTEREVDVIVNEEGKVMLYSEKNDEEYYEPDMGALFFSTKEEAERARIELIPHNKEQVRNYLESFFDEGDLEKMKEWLPGGVFRCFKLGYDNCFFRTHSETSQIKSAIRGQLNMKSRSFRSSEVSHIHWLEKEEAIVTLHSGEEIRTGERNDLFILRCMFGLI